MTTLKQREEFESLTKPLIKWLNDNVSPHSMIVIETDSARLFSGEIGVHTTEFIHD